MRIYRKREVSSFRKKAISTMLIIVIPLFAAITLFVVFTMRNQHATVRAARISTLSAYHAQIESASTTASSYLESTVASNMDFHAIVYAETKTEAYVASEAVAKTLRPLLDANELLGGFYTYSSKFDYFRANNLTSYPLKDAMLIRSAIIRSADDIGLIDWKPIVLSDRIVLLSTAVFQDTVIAAVMDPSRQSYSGIDEGGYVFTVLPGGQPYAESLPFPSVLIQKNSDFTQFYNSDGILYEAAVLPLSGIPGSILYAAPSVSPFQHLTTVQILLLLVSMFLLLSIPAYWMTFRRVLLEPLNNLTATTLAIQAGQTDIHVPETSEILEVNGIAGTVNTMLDTLRQQKIESYEHQLKAQHAQLQYLQMQIRPHFYLNCLNILFSMAEDRNFSAIQELVLDLSAYLRSMFRDSTKLIPLATELRSVESYVRIQKSSVQEQPVYTLDLNPAVADIMIPPLSILTFVENTFTHNKRMDVPLELRIKCDKITSEEGNWLNISIRDNCGGVSETQLQELNNKPSKITQEKHVGILNTKQRLWLQYGDDAMVSFRNLKDGLCVELFLPIEYTETEDLAR